MDGGHLDRVMQQIAYADQSGGVVILGMQQEWNEWRSIYEFTECCSITAYRQAVE